MLFDFVFLCCSFNSRLYSFLQLISVFLCIIDLWKFISFFWKSLYKTPFNLQSKLWQCFSKTKYIYMYKTETIPYHFLRCWCCALLCSLFISFLYYVSLYYYCAYFRSKKMLMHHWLIHYLKIIWKVLLLTSKKYLLKS